MVKKQLRDENGLDLALATRDTRAGPVDYLTTMSVR